VRGYDGPAALLHHDLKEAHLFGVAGSGGGRSLGAVIDWGDATVGDPAADLARLSMAGPAATAAFLEGYGLPLTDHLADRLARYRLVWNTRSLTCELRAGGDWFDAYRTGITDDLRRLA
jgi:aminoglycoside phosphotransferase (APT) family kinase protein